jgi:hypothetical protein
MRRFEHRTIRNREAANIARAMIVDIGGAIGEYLGKVPLDIRAEVAARLSICLIGQGVSNSILSMGGNENDIDGVVDEALRPVYDYAEMMGR